jgi:GMP synthase (glutamine-hydrolysing)
MTAVRHLAVLDPGLRVAELDCFNRLSCRAPLPCTYHLPALFGLDSLLRAEDGLAGVVVLGSGASVHDALPWQSALMDWLAPRLAAGLPFLGLCYGHQLLAHLYGARVEVVFPGDRKARGWRRVDLDPNPLWGAACGGEVLVSHREAVVYAPPPLQVVGRSDAVAIEALVVAGRSQWGLQCHPEATAAFAANNHLGVTPDPAALAFGHGIVDRFTAWVAAHPGGA